MARMAAYAAAATLIVWLAAAPVGVSAATTDDDPADRSNTGDVRTSGIPGADQYSIMQIGPSSTDWIGLSRSHVYWVADRDSRDDRNGRLQAHSVRTSAASGDNRWGWLGLLGLVGLWGLLNKWRMR